MKKLHFYLRFLNSCCLYLKVTNKDLKKIKKHCFLSFLRSSTGLFLIFLVFPLDSLSNQPCQNVFTGTLRDIQTNAQQREDEKSDILPTFTNIIKETELVERWNEPYFSEIRTLENILPHGASFVNHRLRESVFPWVVKMPAQGDAIILRVQYPHEGHILQTNVTVSKNGLIGNLNPQHQSKWLIGPDVQAAILYLHGGGTKSTGGHVAESIINHVNKQDIAVLSPDLAWHGEGPRIFVGTLDDEIISLLSLIKKYIHPGVPTFIYGHSWGGSFAHRAMQMSGENPQLFSSNIKGFIITSPAVDVAPGKTPQQKNQASISRWEQAQKQKKDKIAPGEIDLLESMVENGKTSPVGGFYATVTIAQLNDHIPEHKGSKYLPTLMIVGQGDPLVYVGFEDLFHNYYDTLTKVQTHYLSKLPPLIPNGKDTSIVGHLLGDYVEDTNTKVPVNISLMFKFMNKLGVIEVTNKKTIKPQNINTVILDMLQLYANDLSFREWVNTVQIIKKNKTASFSETRKTLEEKTVELTETLQEYAPRSAFKNLLEESKKQINSSSIKKLKQQALLYKTFFEHDVGLMKRFSLLQEDQSKKEYKEIIEKLLEYPLFSQSNKGYLNAFVKKILTSNTAYPLEKYFYILKDQRVILQNAIQENQKLVQQLQSNYIPTIEDYTQTKTYAEFSIEEIEERIAWIKNNIKEQEILKLKIEEVRRGMHQQKKDLHVNISHLNHHIKNIKVLLEEATLNPPSFLQEGYTKSEKEFDDLYKLSTKMKNQTESKAYDMLDNKEFTLDNMKENLAPYENLIKEFETKYNQYIKNRSNLNKRLLQSIPRGDFSDQIKRAAQELYEPQGLYSRTDALSVRLAQKEAETHQLYRQMAILMRDYNTWVPFETMSSMEIISVKEILNLSMEQHKSLFYEVMKIWNSLGSQTPPTPPQN